MSQYSEISISPCETHHLRQGRPLYSSRFKSVLAFHAPGLAAVADNDGAYHINVQGQPAYKKRFSKSFGFYDDLAAVVDGDKYFHIDANGHTAYRNQFDWCGNFQECLCVVKNNNNYFHVDATGKPIYAERYQYAGDYKTGIAAVMHEGKYFHIDRQGNNLYDRRFQFVDVFHKGYARARDENGWFHIDKLGKAVYSSRFRYVEPFYNDYALAETREGVTARINVNGETVTTLAQSSKQIEYDISDKLVSFWQLHTLNAAIHFNILDVLPASLTTIASRTLLNLEHCLRLMNALWEMKIVVRENNQQWQLTPLGRTLVPSEDKYISAAIPMWTAVNKEWFNLNEILREEKDKYHLCFKDNVPLTELAVYHRALLGYAEKDFSSLNQFIDCSKYNNIFVAGSCARAIIPILLQKNQHLTATLHDSQQRLRDFTLWPEFQQQVSVKSFNLQKTWPEHYDMIIFPRYLHYWPDEHALKILENAHLALNPYGKIYIAEMLLSDNSPEGSLLDLNMMVETGGCLRSIVKWQTLLQQAQLRTQLTQKIAPYVTLLEVTQ